MKTLKQQTASTINPTPLYEEFMKVFGKAYTDSNIKRLVQTLGVSRNTIRKYVRMTSEAEFYGGSSPKNILLILSTITSQEMSAILKTYEKDFLRFKNYDIDKFIHKADENYRQFDFVRSSNKEELDEISESFQNALVIKIYYMTKSPDGVSKQILAKKYGEMHEEVIEGLLSRKLIIQKKDTYYADPTRYIHFERQHIKSIIPTLNSFYRPEDSGKDKNFIYMRLHSINRDAQIDLIHLQIKYKNDVEKILRDEKSLGEIGYYSFIQSGEIY